MYTLVTKWTGEKMLIRICQDCKKFMGLKFYTRPFFSLNIDNFIKWEKSHGPCDECYAIWEQKFEDNKNKERDFMEGYMQSEKNKRNWGGDE
jgi:hypothetical protein